MNGFVMDLIARLHSFPLWGLLLLSFLSACLQQVFPPFPSDILLLFFGGLAAQHVLSGPGAIFPYVAGTIVSSLFVFYFSRRIGKPILRSRYLRKIFTKRNQRRACVYMRKYGAPALIICKFLPGVNTVCLIVGGVMGMSGKATAASIVLAGIAENLIYFFAGMLIGNNLPALYRFSRTFSLAAALIVLVLIAAIVLFKFRGRLFKRAGKEIR